ncbi:MAG: hypothetical protein ACOYM9_17715 [Bradymonadia bacterium]
MEFFEHDQRGRLRFHRVYERTFEGAWDGEAREESTPFPEVPPDLESWKFSSRAWWYRDDALGRLHMYAEDEDFDLPEYASRPLENLSVYEYEGDSTRVLRETIGKPIVNPDGTWGLARLWRAVIDFEYDSQGRLLRKLKSGGRPNAQDEYEFSPLSETRYTYEGDLLVSEVSIEFPVEADPGGLKNAYDYTHCPDRSCRWKRTRTDWGYNAVVERFERGILTRRVIFIAEFPWSSEYWVYDDVGNLLSLHESTLLDGDFSNTVYDYSCWDGSAPIAPPSFATPAPLDFP